MKIEDIEQIHKNIEKAITNGNKMEEAKGRMQLSYALLLKNDEKTKETFEEALALIRRMKLRKWELMLYLNFTPYYLEIGQIDRALSMARRCVDLAEHGGKEDLRILALFNLAEVWYNGFNERHKAIDYLSTAVQFLKGYFSSASDEARMLISNTEQQLANAASSALSLGLVDEAMYIFSLYNPEKAEKLKAMKSHQSKQIIPDVVSLRKINYAELDPILTAWRATKMQKKEVKHAQKNEIVEGMKKFAGDLGWTEVQTRLEQITPVFESSNASQNGPGGFLKLAKMVAVGETTHEAAKQIVKVLQVDDDDLVCLSLFAIQDKVLTNDTLSILLELCTISTTDPVLKARFYYLLALSLRNEESKLLFLLEGDKCLSDSTHYTERARLLNEAALVLASLRRNDESLKMASLAKEMADNGGDIKLATIAANNVGFALMNMGHWDEAVAIFEPLAEKQKSMGDLKELDTTRYNLSVCYMKLGRYDEVKFDENSTDMDTLFNRALFLGTQGQYDNSIKLFEHAFKILDADKKQYDHEGWSRSNFARTLYSAGRIEDAIEQMNLAASLFEKTKDKDNLYDAYSWLAGKKLRDPVICEYYAERALKLARQLDDPEKLAIGLGYMGQVKYSFGLYDDAVKLLEEANHLVDRIELKRILADVLVEVERIDEAITLYENLIASTKLNNDSPNHVLCLLGLANAKKKILRRSEEISLLHEAYSIAATLGINEVRVAAADRLGVALLEWNKLNQAVQVLEDGVDQARKLRLQQEELSLLTNFGNVLKEMGDLEGAKRTLSYVREQSRTRGNIQSEVYALFSLGNITQTEKRFEQALSTYLECADISQTVNKQEVEAACLDSAGVMYTFLGKPGRAIEYHERASVLHEKLKQWNEQLVDIQNLTQAYIALNEMQLSISSLNKAQTIVREHGLRPNWNMSFLEGQVAALQGNWEQARSNFRNAIVDLESIRHLLKTPMEQRKWSANKAYAYHLATEASILASDGGFATELIECNKARFLYTLIQRRTQRPDTVDEETWLQYERAADRRSELQARRRSRLVLGDTIFDHEIDKAESEFTKALAKLQAVSNEEFDKLPEFKFPSWNELAQSIPLNHVAVLIDVYSKGLGIVCIGRDRVGKSWNAAKIYNTFTGSDLDRLIFGDRDATVFALKNGMLDRINPEKIGWIVGSMVERSNTLWNQAITRVCSSLGKSVWPSIINLIPTDINNLILMPSSGFNVLPLHAARLSDGSQIDELFNVTYAPSIGLLQQVLEHNSVNYHYADLGQAVNPTADMYLPFTIIEAHEIAKSFDRSINIVSGDKSTVKHVRDLLMDCHIFHFSGHGFYDTLEPFRSGIICSSESKKAEILSLGNILNSIGSIKSKFIILSACETGQVQAYDVLNDFLGLPGGFIVAGANAVIATLWRVDDLPTCLLLEKFFRLWNKGSRSVPEALAAAQQWMRKEVTVKYITERLDMWLEEATDSNEILEIQHGRWLAREDADTRPFQDEMYWAAFYVTGTLH